MIRANKKKTNAPNEKDSEKPAASDYPKDAAIMGVGSNLTVLIKFLQQLMHMIFEVFWTFSSLSQTLTRLVSRLIMIGKT